MDLLLRIVVVKLPQVGDERPGHKQGERAPVAAATPGDGYSRGQRQLLDVVDADQLADAEAAQMLQRFDAAEAGHRVEELDRRGRQTWAHGNGAHVNGAHGNGAHGNGAHVRRQQLTQEAGAEPTAGCLPGTRERRK